MNALRKGSKGAEVKKWQYFLIGQGYKNVVADGDFGPRTEKATKAFQQAHGLYVDGVVGNQTYPVAMSLGFPLVTNPVDKDKEGPNWPPPPDFSSLSTSRIQERFGPIEFRIKPNGSDIIITNGWAASNLQTLIVPQLAGIEGASSSGKVTFHKKAAAQLQALFQAWENEGLMKYVLSYAGSYNPRLIRGSSTTLSTHAFGIAFDINVPWNGLGVTPALVGETGSVRLLVKTANKHGFYWGGHFTRRDGMHFEIAKLL